jgi:Kef-type K+ transport system membrane component KefB
MSPALAVLAAAGSGDAHGGGFAMVALYLAVILIAAKLGGDLASRLGQPSVLGELVIGIVLGNLGLLGWTALEPAKSDAAIDLLAQLGVLILLFEVGLESTVAQMLKVGVTALLVAVIGVVLPLGLGWGVGLWLLPDKSWMVHAFIGATLSATSVGITARVLKDLGRSQSTEARIILGAAVIDDVLGLVVLAVVSGVIAAADKGGSFSSMSVLWILLKALLFLVGSLGLGVWLSPRLFQLASRLHARQVLLAVGLAFCFLLAWLASAIGLAPIVGAFAAGLILEEVHYVDFVSRGEKPLEETIQPIVAFLAPVFFVVMGMRTDLRAFGEPAVWGLAAALIAAAILGKQACGLAVPRGVDRLSVGVGMIPRGEVGLIFANIGMALTLGGAAVVDKPTFSAIVLMVVVTTLVTPPALKWSLGRRPAPPVVRDGGAG